MTYNKNSSPMSKLPLTKLPDDRKEIVLGALADHIKAKEAVELEIREEKYGKKKPDTTRSMSKYSELEDLRSCAEQGDADLQLMLGDMYYTGISRYENVPEDYAEAVRWYRLAAEQGLAEAQSALALRYADGEGVPEDDAEAVRWYRLAAEQGFAEAQLLLGFMYVNGEGVPEDYVLAYMWWNLAAAQGGEGGEIAQENKDILEERMSREQITEGQRLSREWLEAHPTLDRDVVAERIMRA